MYLNPLKVLPAGKALWYSSISAGSKLDTTPHTKTPITHTLSQIYKNLSVSVVRLALCVRCIGIKIGQRNSVPFVPVVMPSSFLPRA